MADSNLMLEIAGRRFAVSCRKGEEAHITALGRMIDGKARAAGAVEMSEPRMLLFAALMLADELDALRKSPDLPRPAIDDHLRDTLANRVDSLTQRIENIARHLEGEDHHA
ncbi:MULTISPECIES: cell division protein ZapA [unclassified Croceicoccus]|jgi:cell division protein ZapA|uniref:cell division protein ZapA n=1 Tax=unclassified Croceicoccus TaxID=2629967 RepID=UPI001E508EE2|nr:MULTISPECIES: cell division protein ZapA [unclassified Croceicoccus]